MQHPDPNMEIARLIAGFLQGKLSPEEEARLRAWVGEDGENRRTWERLTSPVWLEKQLERWKDEDPMEAWERLKEALAYQRKHHLRMMVRKTLRYAAIVLPLALLCGIGIRFFRSGKINRAEPPRVLTAKDIVPKGKVAQLVLGNGSTVALNDSLEESLTEKDGTKVRNAGGKLSYAATSSVEDGQLVYNTVLTPRGGEYQVRLPDGTQVWLNAASSLRFPTRFRGADREVSLSGEAYFEVAKDEEHPFVIHSSGMTTTVLGTKFNISAYNDDHSQRVTLAEGRVKVSEESETQTGREEGILLNPGYEAVRAEKEKNIRVRKANVDAALAWKNGLFVFDAESLGSMMRKLSRWYDVDVVYENGVDTLFHFTGRIRRYEDIGGILHLLELTGKVHFVIEGRQLKVLPGFAGNLPRTS